jgi:hypothetical protein
LYANTDRQVKIAFLLIISNYIKEFILLKSYSVFFFCIDEQRNPYQPTYTFPKELDGDLERMEDYIRKAASLNIDDDDDDDSKIEKRKLLK